MNEILEINLNEHKRHNAGYRQNLYKLVELINNGELKSIKVAAWDDTCLLYVNDTPVAQIIPHLLTYSDGTSYYLDISHDTKYDMDRLKIKTQDFGKNLEDLGDFWKGQILWLLTKFTLSDKNVFITHHDIEIEEGFVEIHYHFEDIKDTQNIFYDFFYQASQYAGHFGGFLDKRDSGEYREQFFILLSNGYYSGQVHPSQLGKYIHEHAKMMRTNFIEFCKMFGIRCQLKLVGEKESVGSSGHFHKF